MTGKQELEQETKEEMYEEERRRKQEKEKQENDEKNKVTSPKEKQKITDQEKIEIPILELEKPTLEKPTTEIKKIEIDKEIPEIKKEEIKIDIPVIELEKPIIELKLVELDSTLPQIQTKESKLELLLIKLDKAREIRCTINTFDDRLPRVVPQPFRILRVPIYRASKCAVKEITSSFDSRIDAQILQQLVKKKRKEEILKEEQNTKAPPADGEPSGDGEEFEEIPDIVDFIFGESKSKISSKGPKIVLYKELENDSTIGSFETLCIRIYREKKGGDLKFKPIKELDDEFNKKEIEKWMDVHGSLFTIDLDSNKEKAKNWFSHKNLREPLGRAIAAIGDVGFVIFKTRDASFYEYCRRVLEDLENEGEHILDIVYVEPKPLSFEIKKELSSLAWGNLKLDSILPAITDEKKFETYNAYSSTFFDNIFNKVSQRKFDQYLEKLEGSGYSNATKPHEGKESEEHKRMKWFLVKYLTKKLVKDKRLSLKDIKKPKAFEINEKIKTEEDTKKNLNDNVVADVMDTSNNEVYEVETLFAEDKEGKTIEEKLNYTIDKYKDLINININIVLDNLTLLRHLKTLYNVKENKPKEVKERLEFCTLDIQNDRLTPITEVNRKLKEIRRDYQKNVI